MNFAIILPLTFLTCFLMALMNALTASAGWFYVYAVYSAIALHACCDFFIIRKLKRRKND